MNILKDIFNVETEEKDAQLWLQENGEMLTESPFYVRSGTLYDRHDQIRDDILGKAIRGSVTVMAGVSSFAEEGTQYNFVNQSGEIKRKFYRGDLVDILNAVIGNIFDDNPKESERERILSVFRGLKDMRMNIFPNGIENPVAVGNRIIEITRKERMPKKDDDETLPGVLRESFKTIK